MKRKLYCLLIPLFLLATPAFAQTKTLVFQQPQGHPYYNCPNTMIDAEEHNTLILKLKSSQNGAARVFWANSYDMRFNAQKSLSFSIRKGTHKYYFNLPARNPNWIGWTRGLIIYPEFDPNLTKIQEAKLVTGNWLTNFKSGWQEFFAFEAPQLSTVNFIYGPKINGASVNLYIYCLIVILSMLVLTYEFIKFHDLHVAFKIGSKKIVIICLIFWVALDFRILIDLARTAILDAQTFYGKSLDEKRALITHGGYFSFLKFAESKLPKGTSFNILHPPHYYYSREKAYYYLYPTHIADEANYLIVYDPEKILDKEANDYLEKGYKLFARHKEGEYILKK